MSTRPPLPTTPEEIFSETSAMALMLSGMVLAQSRGKDPELYERVMNWADRLGELRVAYFNAAAAK